MLIERDDTSENSDERHRVSDYEGTVRRAVWPPVLAMIALAGVLIFLVFRLLDTAAWVSHSSQVILQANRCLRLAVDMETGKRGFLLDGDPLFLQPYTAAEKEIGGAFDRLVVLTADNPEQQTRAREMQRLFNDWYSAARADIATHSASSRPAVVRAFDDRAGKRRMDAVRAAYDTFIGTEQMLQQERRAASDAAVRYTLIGGGVLVVLVGGALAAATHRQMRTLSGQYESVLDGEARTRERLATTLTSIGDGVMVTGKDGRITLLNPVSETLTGWTEAEARGRDSKEVFAIAHEETGEPVPSPIEQAIRENRIVQLANHTVLKRRDGTQIAIEDSAAPIRTGDGALSGIVLVFRDVTERKRRDNELAAALEKNTRIAETLQRSMLLGTQGARFPGLSLATLYEPAWDEAQVGGDFYDAFAYWTDSVALVVGDATGKGLVAAATTSEVKYALRAYLHEDADPARAMTRLNRFLSDTKQSRLDDDADVMPLSFISMAVAVVNTRTGEGVSVSAGADPPLLLSPSGEGGEIGSAGMMLGASADSEYEAAHFVLSPGDLLAFTTDGVTEARRSRREFFGYEGFTNSVREAARNGVRPAPTLDTIASAVVADAKAYAGGRLSDDVCLLLAKRV